jgi:hypothetical protein
MDFRTYFRKRMIRANLILVAGIALIVAVALLGAKLGLVYPPFIAFVAVVVVFLNAWQVACPKCQENIIFLAGAPRNRQNALPENIHFCPYCGLNLACKVNPDSGKFILAGHSATD